MVRGYFTSDRGRTITARLALDTATQNTIIDTSLMDRSGYPASRGVGIARFQTLTGEVLGYTVRLPRFASLGRPLPGYLVACHDFPENLGIDGVLGLDFFRNARLGLDFCRRRLSMSWPAPRASAGTEGPADGDGRPARPVSRPGWRKPGAAS